MVRYFYVIIRPIVLAIRVSKQRGLTVFNYTSYITHNSFLENIFNKQTSQLYRFNISSTSAPEGRCPVELPGPFVNLSQVGTHSKTQKQFIKIGPVRLTHAQKNYIYIKY